MNSVGEEVLQTKNECEDAIKALNKDFSRAARAWDIYSAIDGSQYEDKKRKVFIEEDRKPWQFDFASAKVDTLAGTIVAEIPDPEWTPIVGDPSILTEALQESYINDKDLFNFGFVLLETIRDGCVHSGWCEIGTSKKYHPAGNISLSHIMPGYFIPDPYWLGTDDSEMMVAYKLGYYNAQRMKQIWQKSGDAINRAIDEIRRGNRQKIPEDRYLKQMRNEPNVGDEWRVVEKHYLEIKNTVRLIGLKEGGTTLSQKIAWIPFPVTEDREKLEKFAQYNKIDWETVQEVPFEKRTHKILTITDLSDDIILEKGDGKTQCNSLPFLHFTTSRINGRDKGIIESIADLQEMFNERMSHIHELIAKASGGSSIYNEELFKSSRQKQEFAKKRNKPGHVEFAALDDVKNIKEDIDYISVNQAIFQQVSVLYNEVLPLVSRVSDTMSAMSNSEDTGVLFEKKYQMNKIANILYDKFAKQLVNNLGEKYFYQWQITYGSTERTIKTRTGREIVLNRETENGIINSVVHTPRCRVVVNENFSSATYQLRQRMQIQEIIKSIPEGDTLRLNAAMGIYFESVPMADKNKALMDMVTEMNNMKAQIAFMTEMSTMQTQIKNNEVLMAQAEMMLARMQSPQMMAAGQRGQPMENKITGNEEIPARAPQEAPSEYAEYSEVPEEQYA